MRNIKLICLPYAGGSKYSYYRYVKLAPDWLEVIPVDLPGRGTRLTETLLTDMQAIVEDLFQQVRNFANSPYAIYGHSMGALTALLLTRRLKQEGLDLPLHLFVTGHGGPAAHIDKIIRHGLPEEELIDELHMLDGMPAEVLNDRMLLDFFLPIIRADFKAFETFQYESGDRLDIPITCLIGEEEPISIDDAMAWDQETRAGVDVRRYPGKHFFIFRHDREIMRLISNLLSRAVNYQEQL